MQDSFGEESIQLVQPSKFFSVTIFRTRSIGMHACELAIFSNAEKFRCLYSFYACELHALFSEGVYKPLIHANKRPDLGLSRFRPLFSVHFIREQRHLKETAAARLCTCEVQFELKKQKHERRYKSELHTGYCHLVNYFTD